MAKIGILTFQNAYNFGAVLQAYALKKHLERTSTNQIDIINYKNKQIEKEQSILNNLRQNNILKEAVRTVLLLPYILGRKKTFHKFGREALSLSAEVSNEELSDLDYDMFIVGSDQVWNLNLTAGDPAFFCNFAKKETMCCSYAASIGASSFSESELNQYRVLLEPFSKISFREKELVPVFKSILPEKKVISCVDPVFLLNRSEWLEIAEPVNRKPYVLFFCVGSNPELEPTIQFATNLALEKGLEPVYLSNQDIWYKHMDWKHCGVCSPNEFIGYIKNAEYVVTNSFHATAFSVILHKDFFSETGLERNGRILNLLEMVNLSDRAIEKGRLKYTQSSIDWDKVDNLIEINRLNSYDYLTELMGDLEK